MYTDPISDLLTRIRNGYKSQKDTIVVPHSVQKLSILKVLKDKKFVSEVKTVKNGKFLEIEIALNPELYEVSLKRISKPGQRIYLKYEQIGKVNGGLGVAVISTPKGVMTGEEAKKLKVGGELICEVY
jgi:small subunit ribosomal protein S8